MSGLRKLHTAVLMRTFEDAGTDIRARSWFEVTAAAAEILARRKWIRSKQKTIKKGSIQQLSLL
jgi:hypothetical protein